MLNRYSDRSGSDAPDENRLDRMLARPFYTAPGVPAGTIGETPVTEIDLSPRAKKGLRKNRVRTIGQLVHTPILSLLNSWGFGQITLWSIEKSLWELLFDEHRSSRQVDFSSFDDMLKSYVNFAIDRERMVNIVFRRLKSSRENKCTLAEIGSQYGITRERVRQIEQQGLSILRIPSNRRVLDPFWREVWKIIYESGQSCSMRIMTRKLTSRLEWNSPPQLEPLCRVLNLHPRLRIDGDRRVSIKQQGVNDAQPQQLEPAWAK